MDIEKYKAKYRTQELGVKNIAPAVIVHTDMELIDEVRHKILEWASDTDFNDLEIKEVKDIATIVNTVASSINPVDTAAPQVNVLVQNFMDGQKDDC